MFLRLRKVTRLATIALTLSIGLPNAAMAEPSGDLVIAVNSLGDESWTAASTGPALQSAGLAIYDSLLIRSPEDGEITTGHGSLSEAMSWSDDRRALTIDLVDNARFHGDWGPVTAEDVVYSMTLARDETSRNGHADRFRSFIDRIEVHDDHSLTFHLTKIGWDFPEELTDVFFHMPIMSKKYAEEVGVEEAGRNPIGSGPFQFESHTFGDRITVTAVEDHWHEAPNLASITWRKVNDPSVRLAMLKSGEAHVTSIVYDQIAEAEAAGLQVKAMVGVNMVTVQFLGMYLDPTYDEEDTPPWAQGNWWEVGSDAHKVRQALSHAIDREAIVEFILQGYGSTDGASVSPFYPGSMGYDADKPVTSYDPDRALELLAEAGYGDPADLEIVVDLTPHSNRPYNKPVGEAIAAMWEGLGISVETRLSTDYATLTGQMRNREAFYAWTWAAPRFTRAPTLVNLIGGANGGSNMFGDPEELSRLLQAGAEAENLEELEANAAALNDYLAETDLAASVAYSANLYATAANFDWPSKPGLAGNAYHNFAGMSLSQ